MLYLYLTLHSVWSRDLEVYKQSRQLFRQTVGVFSQRGKDSTADCMPGLLHASSAVAIEEGKNKNKMIE